MVRLVSSSRFDDDSIGEVGKLVRTSGSVRCDAFIRMQFIVWTASCWISSCCAVNGDCCVWYSGIESLDRTSKDVRGSVPCL